MTGPSPSGAGVLLTGGSGLLGTELRRLLPDMAAPPRSELDILDMDSIVRALHGYRPSVLVHAAAFVNAVGAEQRREECWSANVGGTTNVSLAAADAGVFLVHVSTDYVFDGRRGGYREEDVLGPPFNYYGLTKIAAEAVARTVPRHLVLRTSFRPRQWPYQRAFTDLYTSQDYVDVMGPALVEVIVRAPDLGVATLHVATERKSAFELARRRRPDVIPASKDEAVVPMPDDVSLDTSLWRSIRR